MQTAHGNLHLEIQISRKSPVGILRTSFRENGTIKHTQHGRITGCSLEQLKLLQLAFRERVVPVDDPQAFKILSSREYGASGAIVAIAKQLGLPQALYSRPEPWVSSALAMIVGRLVYAGSKLALCNHHPNTCLWELCGIAEPPEVDVHCYAPMDRLLQRQGAIQKTLARRHLNGGQVVLYDITSVYFEGEYEQSELVTFGYNRDGKKGREQIVVGLICNAQGCPIGVEVYAGNTKDEATVLDKVHEIKARYGIEKIIFVGDRGMVTHSTIESLKDEEDLLTIGALTHAEMMAFVERAFRNLKTVQLEIRPVYHKNDERIRGHVFLCMLAYYLQWHMEQRLAPLFATDVKGQERRWTFRGVIDCLAQITRNRVTVNGAEFYQSSTSTPEQEEILRLLQVSL